MTDLCGPCQRNNYAVFRSANVPEHVKSEKLKEQELHLVEVKKARAYYNRLIAESKEVVKRLEITELGPAPPLKLDAKMHYSFDYAQQVFFPCDPLQPGPMYFLTPRKCGVFGVCCEALPRQVNYLIDEGMAIDKGLTISSIIMDWGKVLLTCNVIIVQVKIKIASCLTTFAGEQFTNCIRE
jgi:hypothetical protein